MSATNRMARRTRSDRRGVAVSVVIGALLAGVAPLGSSAATAAPHHRVAAAVEPLCGQVLAPIQGVVTTEKVISFTFDDGPGGSTRAVMDAFEQRGARATFFLIGKMLNGTPELPPREIAERGNEIGNHSWSHSRSGDRNVKEIARAEAAIEEATGVHPSYYRMPRLGWTKPVLEAAMAQGLCSIDTTIGLGDHKMPRIPGKELCRKFRKRLEPGAIVLLHDAYAHTQTADAVPCILDFALAQGYRIVPLSELLQMAGGDPAKLRLRKMPKR